MKLCNSCLHFYLFCFAAGGEAECVLCGDAKDFSEQIFCTSCGRHYHGRCLDPSVDLTPLIRMGWQCPDCKVCQGCRWADFLYFFNGEVCVL